MTSVALARSASPVVFNRPTLALPYRGWLGRKQTMRWLGGDLVDARYRARRPMLGCYVDGNLIVAVFACGFVFRIRREPCRIDSAWARCLRLLGQ